MILEPDFTILVPDSTNFDAARQELEDLIDSFLGRPSASKQKEGNDRLDVSKQTEFKRENLVSCLKSPIKSALIGTMVYFSEVV
jgi:hypothetical protein